LVTTPQAVALLDVMKCVSFTRSVSLPVLGLIENMSGFVCPCCGEVSNVFSTGGGRDLASKENIPFLGALPVDPELVSLLDAAVTSSATRDPATDGFELLVKYQQTTSFSILQDLTRSIIARLT
jgi:hypothetical protein